MGVDIETYRARIGTFPGLLFADDLAIRLFTVNGLQKGINKMKKYCNNCNLKCNLKKIKIPVCKKGKN